MEDGLVCFICGNLLNGKGMKMLETKTTNMGLHLPSKLGDIIGKQFLILVSEFDQICECCMILFNDFEDLECSLEKIRKQFIELLEGNYDIGFKESVGFDREGSKDLANVRDEITCSICGSLVERKNLNKHMKVEHIRNDSEEDNSKKTIVETNNEFAMVSSSFRDGANESLSMNWDGKSTNAKEYLENFDLSIQDPDESEDLPNVLMGSHVVSTNEYCSNSSSNLDSKQQLIKVEHSELLTNKLICDNRVDNVAPIASSREVIIEDQNVKGPMLLIPSSNIKQNQVSKILEATKLIFKCSCCNFTNEDKLVVLEHSQEHKNRGKTYVCHICEMPFTSNSILSRHMKVHDRSTGPVICTICDLSCHDHLHLIYHHKNKHNILDKQACVLCDKIFDCSKDLKNHILSFHSNNKKFVCNDCGISFKRCSQFESHKLYSHGNQKCRVCGKHIANAVKLRQHENRHARSNMKKLDCNECGRSFKSAGGLRVHKVSHTGEYKFFCEFCGRGFMSNVILEEHKGVHTKEERYICDKCGRKFVLYSTFHLHKQWHKSPFPFPCNLCDRKFKYRSERSNHIRRSHTGEHPHKCTFCSAEFLKSAYLKRHLSLHTKKYPFNCDICKKGFDQRRGLGRHLAKVHKDMSLISAEPKKCQYKVVLRPDEYPLVD